MSRRHLCSFCSDGHGEYPQVFGMAETTMGSPVNICQSCTEDVVNCFSIGIKKGYTFNYSLKNQKEDALKLIRERKNRGK